MDAPRLDVRSDFPFLKRLVNGAPIAYLDNAATTQKPAQVIARITGLYSSGIANVHRAVNFFADEVTDAFEAARETVAAFIAADPGEIVFAGNATHAINLVARSLARNGRTRVVTATIEHHSNLLPWTAYGDVDLIPWDRAGHLDLDALRRSLAARPTLVAVARASNFLGTLQPVRDIIRMCHTAGVPVLVDASQSIAHEVLDVHELGCDYLVFSGHKIYGPGGIGVLYGRKDLMDGMTPSVFGGHMVKEVHADRHVLNDVPHRFEPGTPNIEGVIGLAAALDYVSNIGLDAIARHESALLAEAKRRLSLVDGVRLHGPSAGEPCAPLVAFDVEGVDSNAVAKVLADRANVIVRSGFHCAQSAHDVLGSGPTVRASFGVYNVTAEIEILADILQRVVGAQRTSLGRR